MKVFDPDLFLNVTVTAIDARGAAGIADDILEKASFVLYGKYMNGEYQDFGSEQKPEDTHVVLAYAPRKMKVPNVQQRRAKK